jgi:predicted cupin superfamily sugar epimerase
MTQTAHDWIERLELLRHPEGGWYRELYRSNDRVRSPVGASDDSVPPRERAAITSIYFLLEAPDVSRLHRIDSDELWYWHAGDELRLEVLLPNGHHETHRLGPEASLQLAVPKGSWFGAELATGRGWVLVGCAVAPGFEFAGFELATRSQLLAQFPEHIEFISRLTPAE